MRIGTRRQAVEDADERVSMFGQKSFADLREWRDFAVKIGELLHLILAIHERDELERLGLVPGAARDRQHIAVAISDVFERRIERWKRRRGPLAAQRGLLALNHVGEKSSLLLHRHHAGEKRVLRRVIRSESRAKCRLGLGPESFGIALNPVVRANDAGIGEAEATMLA